MAFGSVRNPLIAKFGWEVLAGGEERDELFPFGACVPENFVAVP